MKEDIPEAVTKAAGDWVIRQDQGLTRGDREELGRWLAAPQHRSEFERLGGAWSKLEKLAHDASLTEEADAILRRSRARRQRRSWAWATAFAGFTLAVAAYQLAGSREAGGERAGPGMGETRIVAATVRRVTLPDGSRANVNGDSRFEILFSVGERRIRLVSGEAQFEVAADPVRPFVVQAGPALVQALGTVFNVKLTPGAIEVLVTEGSVRVEGPDAGVAARPRRVVVSPGERTVLDLTSTANPRPEPAVAVLGRAEIDNTLAWQSTRLIFNRTPLAQVVETFNRYNHRKLTLGSPDLSAKQVTGAFRADNPDGFVRLLEAGEDVRSEAGDAGQIVLFPPSN